MRRPALPVGGATRERKASAMPRTSPHLPLPIAVVGLGGYADTISRLLERESHEPIGAVRDMGTDGCVSQRRHALFCQNSIDGCAHVGRSVQ